MQPPRVLLENCRTNDRKAHHELYVMCFPLLYTICTRYHLNEEDRMSSLNLIFLKLIQQMGKYLPRHHEVPFEQWLRKVALHHIIDEFRKQKRYRELIRLDEETPESDHPFEERDALPFDREEIHQAINSLPDGSRTVFNLFVVDGYRHEEIAGMLGISVGTSKAHLFKARKKLQEILQRQDHGRSAYTKTVS
jgi:RNA polymerase sigma-70 factor (ECF subfamily)